MLLRMADWKELSTVYWGEIAVEVRVVDMVELGSALVV